MTTEQKELLKEIEQETGIDVAYMIESGDCPTMDKLSEAIDDAIAEIGVIYYIDAMEFLLKHDTSLMKSMELADSYGIPVADLHSEILATILKREVVRESFEVYLPKLERLFFTS